MFFAAKAVKKIFNLHKKVIKGVGNAFGNKWVQIAGLAALTVFATGLGSSGFSGFKTAQQVGGGGLAGFFNAVGSTMSNGFSTIKNGAAGLFASGGAASQLPSSALEGSADFIGPPSSLAGNFAANAALTQAGNVGGRSLASRMIGGLFGNSAGASMARNAIMAGIMFNAQKGQSGVPSNVKARANIYGGRARKGTPEVPEGLIRRPIAQTDRQVNQGTPAADSIRPTPSPTLAQPLLGGATDIATLPGVRPLLAGAV